MATREDFTGKRNDVKFLMPVAAATVISTGDALFYDAATNQVLPASDQADQGSEQDNQELFAQNFCGISEHDSLANATVDVLVNADLNVQHRVQAVSATYAIGDFLALNENAGGTALENREYVAVENEKDATMVVTQEETTATTTVFAKPIRSVLAVAGGQPRLYAQIGDIETLSADRVVTEADPTILQLDPGGAGRNVDMPSEAASRGQVRIIKNEADAAEDLTVRDSGAAVTIVVISQDEGAVLWCDGTKWDGIVGGET